MKDTRPSTGDAAAFRDDGFIAIRTPLLPLDVLVEWSQGLKAPGARPEEREAALAEDRALLRQRLRAHVADPVVREALFIASPSLDESLPAWLERPDSEAGLKVEHTLVRYLARMAGRATPFGLFAGHAVGSLGEGAALRMRGRSGIRRHTRLDMDYVTALVAHVCRSPEAVRELRYVPNSSIYRAGGQLRYLESRQNNRERSYHLVAVEPAPVLDATLERAGAALGGVTLEELARPLATEADVPREEALEYLESLVAAQLLVPAWAPLVTQHPQACLHTSSTRTPPGLSVLRSSPAWSKRSVRSFLGSSTVAAKAGLSSSSPGSAPARGRRLPQLPTVAAPADGASSSPEAAAAGSCPFKHSATPRRQSPPRRAS